MREAQVRALEDEEIGVRHRLLNYYIPLLLQWANGRGAHPESMRVLDCGCGNGASVEFLAAAGFQAFGIDLASLRADSWKQRARLPGVNLIQADATRLPFANHEFDIVLSSGMLEHIGVAESCTPQYVSLQFRTKGSSDKRSCQSPCGSFVPEEFCIWTIPMGHSQSISGTTTGRVVLVFTCPWRNSYRVLVK
jgi:SAM-dependent methyltransferase